jgi:RES domain-containing protein
VSAEAATNSRTLWRISNFADLRGSGGIHSPSRWSTTGHRIVYLAESPPGAMLEILAHLQFEEDELPDEYQLLAIDFPEKIEVREIKPPSHPDWKARFKLTQRIGDTWLNSRQSALARVPSAVMPRTWNVLLNPAHADAAQVRIREVIRERFDIRLFRFGAQ